ncbi:CTP synthase [Candidatus Woesebacteria bacterium]|nr:CTP synthase [Candidatus Woesebacteria bacterium]
MKYIIIAGGVLSGLGKGITAASLGLLLNSRGIRTTLVKCDMYLNIDAGTMNPLEHGEVFVTHDGLETDQDLGHYERFINKNIYRENYMTNGQIYWDVLQKERALFYKGKCVEPYHQIPPEIAARWERAGKVNNAQVVIVELGGTVGEYEGLLFFEAARRIKLERPHDIAFMLVGYLPAPSSIGELKSKPLQQSVQALNSLGIQPDFIIARAEREIDEKRKEKIHLASGVPVDHIIANPDVASIYDVPLVLERQNVPEMVAKSLKIKLTEKDMKEWRHMISEREKATKKIRVGIIGKYQKTGDYTLSDTYVCVVEALKHGARVNEVTPELVWINSEDLEGMTYQKSAKILRDLSLDGIVVPQGWGKRGVEGKVTAIRFAREEKVPYLGLCFGMQMAVIEFGRNVLHLANANTQEADPKTKHPVIHVIESQKKLLKNKQYGGTIRLGAWACTLTKGTKLEKIYTENTHSTDAAWLMQNPMQEKLVDAKGSIFERHRHRYEFNIDYKEKYEKAGMTIAGLSPDKTLVEAIEIADHPFFIGTQFHPEYLSRPLAPHPLFIGFTKACKKTKK